MKTKIFNLIILDESGSMDIIKRQAVTGVNETIQTIRAAQEKYDDQQHLLTFVSFNSSGTKCHYDCVEIGKVNEITDDMYNPQCGTPLFDAIGYSVTKLRKSVADGGKVLVTIITDGYENSSVEYNLKSIESLIKSFTEKGWVFTYIGANQNVSEVASSLSIKHSMEFSSTAVGACMMFEREKKARQRFFNSIHEGVVDEDYFAE